MYIPLFPTILIVVLLFSSNETGQRDAPLIGVRKQQKDQAIEPYQMLYSNQLTALPGYTSTSWTIPHNPGLNPIKVKVLSFNKYHLEYSRFPFLQKDSVRYRKACEAWSLDSGNLSSILTYLTPAVSDEDFYSVAIFRECGYKGKCEYKGKVYDYEINAGGWAKSGFSKYGLHSLGASKVNHLFLDTFDIGK